MKAPGIGDGIAEFIEVNEDELAEIVNIPFGEEGDAIMGDDDNGNDGDDVDEDRAVKVLPGTVEVANAAIIVDEMVISLRLVELATADEDGERRSALWRYWTQAMPKAMRRISDRTATAGRTPYTRSHHTFATRFLHKKTRILLR